jgi:hypothetical protein
MAASFRNLNGSADDGGVRLGVGERANVPRRRGPFIARRATA